MARCIINKLPEEIFVDIIRRVKEESEHRLLIACLLCCKRWHNTALREFYRDIVLLNSNLEPFTKRFPSSQSHLVRSLTVKIDPPKPANDPNSHWEESTLEDQDHLNQHGSMETKSLWHHLQQIPTIIRRMINLTTFSLSVSPTRYPNGFWLPRAVLASALAALPETCVNLEPDTRSWDYAGPGSVHLCETLAKIIPRLYHLRLRVSAMCPALLGPDFSIDGSVKDPLRLKPAHYPFLKTAIINCVMIKYNHCYVCGTFEEDPTNGHWLDQHIPEARIALTRSLRELVLLSRFPVIERLWLLDDQPCDDLDRSVYAAYNRRDIVNDKTWAIPYEMMKGFDKDSWLWLTRTPEGLEVFSHLWAIEILAEGETWKETHTGSRFPSVMLARQEYRDGVRYIVKNLPFTTAETYRSLAPRQLCRLWYHEEMTGMPLLWATERNGLVDTTPLKELTPPGWKRLVDRDGMVFDLVKDE